MNIETNLFNRSKFISKKAPIIYHNTFKESYEIKKWNFTNFLYSNSFINLKKEFNSFLDSIEKDLESYHFKNEIDDTNYKWTKKKAEINHSNRIKELCYSLNIDKLWFNLNNDWYHRPLPLGVDFDGPKRLIYFYNNKDLNFILILIDYHHLFTLNNREKIWSTWNKLNENKNKFNKIDIKNFYNI